MSTASSGTTRGSSPPISTVTFSTTRPSKQRMVVLDARVDDPDAHALAGRATPRPLARDAAEAQAATQRSPAGRRTAPTRPEAPRSPPRSRALGSVGVRGHDIQDVGQQRRLAIGQRPQSRDLVDQAPEGRLVVGVEVRRGRGDQAFRPARRQDRGRSARARCGAGDPCRAGRARRRWPRSPGWRRRPAAPCRAARRSASRACRGPGARQRCPPRRGAARPRSSAGRSRSAPPRRG